MTRDSYQPPAVRTSSQISQQRGLQCALIQEWLLRWLVLTRSSEVSTGYSLVNSTSFWYEIFCNSLGVIPPFWGTTFVSAPVPQQCHLIIGLFISVLFHYFIWKTLTVLACKRGSPEFPELPCTFKIYTVISMGSRIKEKA